MFSRNENQVKTCEKRIRVVFDLPKHSSTKKTLFQDSVKCRKYQSKITAMKEMNQTSDKIKFDSNIIECMSKQELSKKRLS